MKIAIVGSGISELVSAYHLSPRAEVHLFEANSCIGGHTNTIDVETPSGILPIDTGFIVFNDWNYPRFVRLLNELNIPSQPSNMSFSVRVEKSGLEYNGTSLSTLFAQKRNLFRPSFYRMIRDILRFNKESVLKLEQNKLNDISLGKFLSDGNYSDEFINHYIIPMGAAIWSAGTDQMRDIPALFFVRFFKNHGMLSVDERPTWRVIQNGSKSYIPYLTKNYRDNIHLNSPVRKIQRTNDRVILNVEQNGAQQELTFDQVVCAGHGDQMLKLLDDPTPEERRILSCFRYQKNPTVLHTDISVMPKIKRAWAAWNYVVPKEDRQQVAVTYDMNILQSIKSEQEYLVSLNMNDHIDPRKIIKKINYEHPIYSFDSVKAQSEWDKISGPEHRTHYCGAYWGNGFHEDGVVSAERVCASLGVKLS